MTICIVAVCAGGANIVVAADRMFTFLFPLNTEFETEERKVEELGPRCVALVSGDSAAGAEVLAGARNKLRNQQDAKILEVAGWIKEDYAAVKNQRAYDTIAAPALGPDFKSFLAKGGTLPAYLQPQPQVYQQLVTLMAQHNLGLELIIAGIDETGACVSLVVNPGLLVNLDKLGYHCIGTGGIHALTWLSLNGQTRSRELTETLYSVYEAKKTAEVAPGVGKATDIIVVDSKKDICPCSDEVLNELERLHSEAGKRPSPKLDKLREVLGAE